jgi:indolepyruvate ferredoxin oxidoreductase beta subunit
MKTKGDILFCGVGGQGIVLASEITSHALMASGFDVKKSEVHGMAQRGGSVLSHLRYGAKVYSPLIVPGGADVAVAFELLESLRYLEYLKPSSRVVVNTQRIAPLSVATGYEKYPSDIIGKLKRRGLSVRAIDAFDTAKALRETRAVNVVMVGALSRLLPVKEKFFIEAIREKVREHYLEINLEAFKKGRALLNP